MDTFAKTYFIKMSRIAFIMGAIALMLITSSCNPIVRSLYGIKKPKVEDEDRLKKYLNKNDIADHNIYTVNKEDFKSILALNNNKIPEMMVFDRSGQQIVYREDSTCNAGATAFIDQLHPDRKYPVSDKTNLSTELGRLRHFDGETAQVQVTEETDYVILMNWARYMGRLNKTQVKAWEEHAEKNSQAKIEVFKVNLDFQEFWQLGKAGEKPKIQLEK